MNTTTQGRRLHRSGLFRRIFFAFLFTVIAFAAAVGTMVFLYANAHGPGWVDRTLQTVEASHERLFEQLDDPPQLEQTVTDLSRELDARMSVYGHRGRRIAGRGPHRLPHPVRRRRHQLRKGRPVVWRPTRFSTPLIYWGLVDPHDGELAAIVRIDVGPGWLERRRLLFGSGVLLLGALAVGAYLLARSLTGRLGLLEMSAGRIARGDIAHRVDVGKRAPSDEIDQLGLAFNEMAEKIEALLRGQRRLLANVSHELRTPIARIKVLLEILEERTEGLAAGPDEKTQRDTDRVRKGLREMAQDIEEVELLIGDLLTSGRLELSEGGERVIDRKPFAVATLLGRLASRFDAEIECEDPGLEIAADELLLQRLLSNLLGNARRACPDGRVTIGCRRTDDGGVEIAVEDEGPGIPEEDREAIFEPFARLDAARTRDRGGVGLGLHLCRQIAKAHGGTVEAQDRTDGRRGARLVVRIPAVDA